MPTTKNAQLAHIKAVIASRHGIIWMTSVDTRDVQRALHESMAPHGIAVWHRHLYCLEVSDATGRFEESAPSLTTCLNMLQRPDCEGWRRTPQNRRVPALALLTIGLTSSGEPALADEEVARLVRYNDLRATAPNALPAVVVVCPRPPMLRELLDHCCVLTWPRLSHADIRDILARTGLDVQALDRLVTLAQGSTRARLDNIVTWTSAMTDGQGVDRILEETLRADREQLVRSTGILDWIAPETGAPPVLVGLGAIQHWVESIRHKLTEDAGADRPRGMLLAGMTGCGKSAAARATPRWLGNLPCLRLDMSRILGPYVGTSERNLRDALQLAEGLAPAVLWIDEIEKALPYSEKHASETGARLVGMLLTWMQETTAPVFTVLTANRVDGLPSELLRSGRIDRRWRVGPPSVAHIAIMIRNAFAWPEGDIAVVSQAIHDAHASASDVVAIIAQMVEQKSQTTEAALTLVANFKTVGGKGSKVFEDYDRQFATGSWSDADEERAHSDIYPFLSIDIRETRARVAIWRASEFPECFRSVRHDVADIVYCPGISGIALSGVRT